MSPRVFYHRVRAELAMLGVCVCVCFKRVLCPARRPLQKHTLPTGGTNSSDQTHRVRPLHTLNVCGVAELAVQPVGPVEPLQKGNGREQVCQRFFSMLDCWAGPPWPWPTWALPTEAQTELGPSGLGQDRVRLVDLPRNSISNFSNVQTFLCSLRVSVLFAFFSFVVFVVVLHMFSRSLCWCCFLASPGPPHPDPRPSSNAWRAEISPTLINASAR